MKNFTVKTGVCMGTLIASAIFSAYRLIAAFVHIIQKISYLAKGYHYQMGKAIGGIFGGLFEMLIAFLIIAAVVVSILMLLDVIKIKSKKKDVVADVTPSENQQ